MQFCLWACLPPWTGDASTIHLWGTSSDKMFVLVQHDEACVSEGRARQSRTQHWIASLEWEETPKIQGANFQETRRELRFCPWHPFAWEYTATATATVAGSAATPLPSLLRCNKPHISRWPGVCHRIALGPPHSSFARWLLHGFPHTSQRSL